MPGVGPGAVMENEAQKMMTDTGRFLHIQVSNIDSNRSSIRGGQVLMFRDVSDVEKAQMEVRKNEKLLRTLIDHSASPRPGCGRRARRST